MALKGRTREMARPGRPGSPEVVAVHEAGHEVIARHHGLGIDESVVHQLKRPRRGELGGFVSRGGGSIEQEIDVLLGGFVAQSLFLKRREDYGCQLDFEAITELVGTLDLDEPDARRLVELRHDLVLDVLSERWSELMTVARRLLSKSGTPG